MTSGDLCSLYHTTSGKDAGSALGRRARIRAAGKAVASALQPRRFATLDHTDVLELLTLFDGLDADGDGTVTRHEFVKKLQYTLGSRADKIFSAMDAVGRLNHVLFFKSSMAVYHAAKPIRRFISLTYI